ncbi:hypothetical protein IWW57_002369, partial [Coemansia sp. S610]
MTTTDGNIVVVEGTLGDEGQWVVTENIVESDAYADDICFIGDIQYSADDTDSTDDAYDAYDASISGEAGEAE